ncbi:MAG: PIG-L family deacetylase [Planctomycetota bacterium]
MKRQYPILLDRNLLPRGGALAFAPHPDDEVIGCGGALTIHRDRGERVRVVFLTDGALGDKEGKVEGDLIAIRERESSAALSVLGIEESEHWHHPDGGLTESSGVEDQVRELVKRWQPEVVYFPSIFEIHPDHVAAGRRVARGLQQAGFAGWAMMYEVGNQHLATHLLDITPEQPRKREALSQYASQMSYHDLIDKTQALNRFRSVNLPFPEMTHIEAFLRMPVTEYDELEKRVDSLFELVERHYVV